MYNDWTYNIRRLEKLHKTILEGTTEKRGQEGNYVIRS